MYYYLRYELETLKKRLDELEYFAAKENKSFHSKLKEARRIVNSIKL